MCTNIHASVCVNWRPGLNPACFRGDWILPGIANYRSVLIWGSSMYWLPLSPWTSVSKVGWAPSVGGNGGQVPGARQRLGGRWGGGTQAVSSPHRAPRAPPPRPTGCHEGNASPPREAGTSKVGIEMSVVGVCCSNAFFVVFAVQDFCCKEHSVVRKISSWIWIISILNLR